MFVLNTNDSDKSQTINCRVMLEENIKRKVKLSAGLPYKKRTYELRHVSPKRIKQASALASNKANMKPIFILVIRYISQ